MRSATKGILAVAALALCGVVSYMVFTGHMKTLTPLQQSAPSLSADGRWFTFDIIDGQRAYVATMSRDATQLRMLTQPATISYAPIWFDAGRLIVFARADARYHHLWRMQDDGTHQVQVTFGHVIDRPIVASQDGNTVYFLRENWTGRLRLPRYEIWGVAPGGTRAEPWLVGSGLAISADGSTIALAFPAGTPEAHDVGATMLPVQWACDGYSPALSPDGTKMVFIRGDGNGNDVVWLTNRSNMSHRIIDDSPGMKSAPSFSSSGTEVVFRAFSTNLTDTTIVVASLESSAKQRVSVRWRERRPNP